MNSPQLHPVLLTRKALAFAGSVAALLGGHAVQAADQTWAAAGFTDGNWAVPANWAGLAVPGGATGVASGDTATFNADANLAVTPDATRNIKNILFDIGAGAFVISGGGLVLTNAGSVTMNAGVTATETINTNLLLTTTASATYSFVNNSSTVGALLNIGGSIAGQATSTTQVVTLSGSNNGEISGNITNGIKGGTVGVTMSGTGVWTLSGTNAYSGTTTLNSGQLNLNTAAALGTGAFTIVGGTIDNTSAAAVVLSSNGQINLNGNLNFGGTKDLTFGSGSVKFGTSRTITLGGSGSKLTFGGEFDFNNDGAPARTLTVNGVANTLQMGGYAINSGGSGGKTATVNGDANIIITGPIRNANGGNAFTYSGTGSLTLSGVSTFTGTLTISSGAFRLGADNVLPDGAGKGNVALAGTLDLNTYSETINGLSGAGVVDTVAGGTPTLTVGGNNQGGTFTGVIKNTAGTLGLTKTGTGTLTLSGLNAYTGSTKVSGGTLLIDLATNNNGVLAATTPLFLDGGIFNVRGKTGAFTSTQTVGNLSLSANLFSSLVVNRNTGTSLTLTVGNTWTRPAGSVLFIDASSGGGLISSPIAAGTQLSTDSIIKGVIITNGTTGLATNVGGNVVRYTGAAALTATSNDGGTNFNITANPASVTHLPNTGTWAVNSLELSSAGTIALDLGGETLSITSGMLYRNGGQGVTISNGQLGASNQELIYVQRGINNTCTVSAAISGGTGSLTVSTTSGTAPALGSANSMLVLTGISNYSGGTTITNGGGLQIGNGATGSITGDVVNNGILQFGRTTAYEFSGNISGNGQIAQFGSGTLTLSGANTFVDKTTILNGTLSVASLNRIVGGTASSNLGAPITAALGTIAIGSGAVTAGLTYTGTGETTDRVINLAGTTGGATLDQSGTGLLQFTSAFTATGTGSKTLTLQGATMGTGEIAAAIVDKTAVTATTGVTKSGTGTWTLSGTNTYTGPTIVNGGTLLVNGVIHSGSAVTVNDTGTLGGTNGTVGAVAVADGGAIAPGGSVGILNTGSVNFATGAQFRLELNGSTVGSGYDQLNVTGAVNLNSDAAAGADLFVTLGAGFTPAVSDTFRVLANDNDADLISGFFGSVNGSAFGPSSTFNLANDTGTYAFQLYYSGEGSAITGGNDLVLQVVAVVPEPGSWVALLSGCGLLLGARRRRALVG